MNIPDSRGVQVHPKNDLARFWQGAAPAEPSGGADFPGNASPSRWIAPREGFTVQENASRPQRQLSRSLALPGNASPSQ